MLKIKPNAEVFLPRYQNTKDLKAVIAETSVPVQPFLQLVFKYLLVAAAAGATILWCLFIASIGYAIFTGRGWLVGE